MPLRCPRSSEDRAAVFKIGAFCSESPEDCHAIRPRDSAIVRQNGRSGAGCIGERRQAAASITPSKPGTKGCVETVRLLPERAKSQSSQQARQSGRGNAMLDAKPLVGGSIPSGGARNKMPAQAGIVVRERVGLRHDFRV